MLRNYLKIALRNLLKSKGYSAINICHAGVALEIRLPNRNVLVDIRRHGRRCIADYITYHKLSGHSRSNA